MHAPSILFCQEESTIHRQLSKDQRSESAGRVSRGYDRQVREPAAELPQAKNPLSNGFLSLHLGSVKGTPSTPWACLCFISDALIKHPDKKQPGGETVLQLTVPGCSPSYRRSHSGRDIKQLITSIESMSRENRVYTCLY